MASKASIIQISTNLLNTVPIGPDGRFAKEWRFFFEQLAQAGRMIVADGNMITVIQQGAADAAASSTFDDVPTVDVFALIDRGGLGANLWEPLQRVATESNPELLFGYPVAPADSWIDVFGAAGDGTALLVEETRRQFAMNDVIALGAGQ